MYLALSLAGCTSPSAVSLCTRWRLPGRAILRDHWGPGQRKARSPASRGSLWCLASILLYISADGGGPDVVRVRTWACPRRLDYSHFTFVYCSTGDARGGSWSRQSVVDSYGMTDGGLPPTEDKMALIEGGRLGLPAGGEGPISLWGNHAVACKLRACSSRATSTRCFWSRRSASTTWPPASRAVGESRTWRCSPSATSFYAIWDWRWCLLLAGVTATGFVGALLLGAPRGTGRGSSWSPCSSSTSARSGRLQVPQLLRRLVLRSPARRRPARRLGDPAPRAPHRPQLLPLPEPLLRDRRLQRQLRATRGVVEYATALSFFPQLLAGPITRPRDLLPQLFERRGYDDARARDGLRQVLWGLTKKMLIADNIGVQVDYVWRNTSQFGGVSLVAVAVLYSMQIYCDFSGYADIAIGTAKLFNLRLSKNFDYPYFSVSVRMFWRRWHITLASWMRDYVYIPLGGNRVGPWRLAFNVLVTFLLVGLWHGANWTFVIWGGLHGIVPGRRKPPALRRCARAQRKLGAGARRTRRPRRVRARHLRLGVLPRAVAECGDRVHRPGVRAPRRRRRLRSLRADTAALGRHCWSTSGSRAAGSTAFRSPRRRCRRAGPPTWASVWRC